MLATVAPAFTTRKQIAAQSGSRTATRRSGLPGLLVALQVALTCVLLVVTGLFVRTLQSLENVKLGFDPRGVTTLVAVPANDRETPQHVREMETELLHRFESLPEVESVTMQTEVPFSSYNVTLDAASAHGWEFTVPAGCGAHVISTLWGRQLAPASRRPGQAACP